MKAFKNNKLNNSRPNDDSAHGLFVILSLWKGLLVWGFAEDLV
jgi:hypothetical protein